MSDSYEEWLIKQNAILAEALDLIKSFGFDASIIRPKDKKAFIRIIIGKNKSDFHLKSIKNRFIKFAWVCRKEDFDPNANYLVYLEAEEKFLVAIGSQVDEEGEFRNSDFHQGKKYVVAPIGIFRSAKTFFKSMKCRLDAMLQRRMNEWT